MKPLSQKYYLYAIVIVFYLCNLCEIQLLLIGLFNNPSKPVFTLVIFIHYKPRIAVAILDL